MHAKTAGVKRWRPLLNPGLAALLLLQGYVVAQLVRPARAGEEAGTWILLGLGDRVSEVSGVDSLGAQVALTLAWQGREPTVVLAFHSQCGHCATVGPSWTRWIQASPSRRVVLMAREAPAAALAFVHHHALQGDLVAVPEAIPGSPEWALTMRTPTIFVVDAEGQIIFVGHGSEVAAVDSVLSAAAGEFAGVEAGVP